MSVTSGTKRKEGGLAETGRVIFHALIIALVIRTFLFQPFNIPSGSMKETLLVGDYLFVSKLSYGYSRHSLPFGSTLLSSHAFDGRIFASQPKRGDVVVFKYPRDNSTDYIKRLIGLPGDRIQMLKGVLYINGKAVPKRRVGSFDTYEGGQPVRNIPVYEETLPEGVRYHVLDAEENGPTDDTGVYEVPPGHYFMMGDNRDNSSDSRIRDGVGYVPFENLVGRAEIIFFSGAFDEPKAFRLLTPWTWPLDIRWSRFFNRVR
jgi:signal peptidase I